MSHYTGTNQKIYHYSTKTPPTMTYLSDFHEGYDLDGISYESWVRSAHKSYELQLHEVQSLQEIKSMLTNGMYTDSTTVRAHLEYLEKLIDKLNMILGVEEREGVQNLGLRRDLMRIKRDYKKLLNHYERLMLV